MDQDDISAPSGHWLNDGATESLGQLGERTGQESDARAGEDERQDRLPLASFNSEVRRDTGAPECLLEQGAARSAWRRCDDRDAVEVFETEAASEGGVSKARILGTPAGWEDDEEVLAPEIVGDEPRSRAVVDDPQLGSPRADQVVQCEGVLRRCEPHDDARVRTAERPDQWCKRRSRQGRQAGYVQLAGFESDDLAHRRPGGDEVTLDTPGGGYEGPAGSCELHATADAKEQWRAQLRLELTDCLRHGRLGAQQDVSRPGEATLLDNLQEDRKPADIHNKIGSRLPDGC